MGAVRARAVLPMARVLAAPRRWNQQASAQSHIFADADLARRRLLYRSKQRGWLEMDIMLGNWVSASEREDERVCVPTHTPAFPHRASLCACAG